MEPFSISSKSRIDSLSLSVCHRPRASCVSSEWVSQMTQIAGRRADQLCYLVRLLELSTVNLDAGKGVAKQ